MEDTISMPNTQGRVTVPDNIRDTLCVLIADYLVASPARSQDETDHLAGTLSLLRMLAHLDLSPDDAMACARDVVANFKAAVVRA